MSKVFQSIKDMVLSETLGVDHYFLFHLFAVECCLVEVQRYQRHAHSVACDLHLVSVRRIISFIFSCLYGTWLL